jgi:hypothetical protein
MMRAGWQATPEPIRCAVDGCSHRGSVPVHAVIPRPSGSPGGLVVWLCADHAADHRGAGFDMWLARHRCLPRG